MSWTERHARNAEPHPSVYVNDAQEQDRRRGSRVCLYFGSPLGQDQRLTRGLEQVVTAQQQEDRQGQQHDTYALLGHYRVNRRVTTR